MTINILRLALCATLCTLSASAQAQQQKISRIAFLTGGGTTGVPLEVFRKALRELGYVEGKNLVIEQLSADGKVPADLGAELTRRNIDVIVTSYTGATEAARNATSTIPIVMMTSTDPIGLGFIASLARPGGNITGLTSISGELGGKLLDLLKETMPRLSRLAIVHTGSPAQQLFLKETEPAAQALKVRLLSVTVQGPDRYDDAIRAAANKRADALLTRFPPATNTAAQRTQFAAASIKRRLALVSQNDVDTEAGALLSYGPDRIAQFRRAATYVDKILKGRKPADLPVEQPMKFEMVINLKTAKQIGLTIPQSVLYRADRVIR